MYTTNLNNSPINPSLQAEFEASGFIALEEEQREQSMLNEAYRQEMSVQASELRMEARLELQMAINEGGYYG